MSVSEKIKRLPVYCTSNWFQLLIFSLIHLGVLFIWLNYSAFAIRIHPDVELYLRYAELVFSGNLPYRDFFFEYPPLALPIILLPRLFSSSLATYADIFAFLMVGFDLVGLWLASKFSTRLKLNHFSTLLIYTMAFAALGDIVINRFDIVAAVLSMAAIYFYINNRQKSAWVMLALATLTKLYPAIYALLFALGYLCRHQYRMVLKRIALYCVIGLAGILPFLLIGSGGFWEFLNYHSTRGLQLESGYASLLMLLNLTGITSLEVISGPASLDVTASCIETVIIMTTVSSFLAVGLSCWFYYLSIDRYENHHDSLICICLGMTALLLVASKVFSTQFVIWLFPLVPLVSNRMRHPVWIMFVIIALLSCYIFPHNYGDLVDLNNSAVIILILRNLLVTIMGIMLVLSGSGFLKSFKIFQTNKIV